MKLQRQTSYSGSPISILAPDRLQHDKLLVTLKKLRTVKSHDTLEISFESCLWADHFELQKLAVHIALCASCCARAIIRLTHSQSIGTLDFKNVEFLDYACRIQFFGFLQGFWGERISFTLGSAVIDSGDLDIDSRILALLPETRITQQHSRSFLPMTPLVDNTSFERVTKSFATGESIQAILDYYVDIEFLKSGEFSALIVNEVAQNIMEHAWPDDSPDAVGKPAAISLVIASLGNRKDPVSRFAVRSRYAPLYERSFLAHLDGPGYLELCVSDAGIGIPKSLSLARNSWPDWFDGKAEAPIEGELLAAAFWAKVTRDSGPHRPGYRGLFYAFECVREYRGALAAHCHDAELAVVANNPRWLSAYKQRDPLRPTSLADVTSLPNQIQGTHLRILLPLTPKIKRRSHWLLKITQQPSNFLSSPPVNLLPIVPAPAADSSPRTADSLRLSMEEFRFRCKEALAHPIPFTTIPDSYHIWLTACAMREWKKHHFQTLLDEILLKPDIKFIFFLNVPKTHFFSFLFVARHVVSIEHGHLVVLVDESGRIALAYRDHKSLYENFMRWATEGSAFQLTSDDSNGFLFSFTAEFNSVSSGIPLSHYMLLMMRQGIAIEFAPTLEAYRNSDDPIKIDAGLFIRGYIELDEALRESRYLRTISSFVDLSLRAWLRPDGIIAVRRAATRLLEFSPLMDRHVWVMSSPAKEHLPSVKWMEGKKLICIVTDVVARGTTLARLLLDLLQKAAHHSINPTFVMIAPLLGDLNHLGDSASDCSLTDSPIPGMSLLYLREGGCYPLLWIQRTDAEVVAVDPAAQSLVPDKRTNIVVEEQTTAGLKSRSQISGIEFIRLAELQNAIWSGHLVITEEHFDLEFNMSRLLREGSSVVEGFGRFAAQIIVEKAVDAIIFPDESRIQLAIPALEDALRRLEAEIPIIVRCRRGSEGMFFVRPRDRNALFPAKTLLLLDDAINSGGTARQMLQIASIYPNKAVSLILLVIISRQNDEAEEFLSGITAFNGVSFEYHSYARFPVKFFSSTDCPLCFREKMARSFSVPQGPPSVVSLSMQTLAEALRPIEAYLKSPLVPSRAEERSAYQVPLHADGGIELQRVTTRLGARAAIALAIAEHKMMSPVVASYILRACREDACLLAYAFYAISSRCPQSEDLWEDEEFRSLFSYVCNELGQKSRADASENETTIANAGIDLCVAAWFAPHSQGGWAIGTLIKRCPSLLSHDRFYQEILLLTTKAKGDVGIAEGVDGATKPLTDLRSALVDSRRTEVSVLRHSSPPLDAIERLIRLRQISQIVDSLPFREPWLEGVVQILERFSFHAGHEWIGFISGLDVATSGDVIAELEALLGSESQTLARETGLPAELREKIEVFLSTPTQDIIRIGRSLKESFGGWFRALNYANLLDNLAFFELELSRAEDAAKELLVSLAEANADLHRESDNLLRVLKKVHGAQTKLREILFLRATNGELKLRSQIEQLLCPLYSLGPRFRKSELIREFSQNTNRISLDGSFFSYMEQVGARDNKDKPRWTVLFAPFNFVSDVLRHTIVSNPQKHVTGRLGPLDNAQVHVDIAGLDSLDHKLTIRIELLINGMGQALPEEIWMKTVGNQRRILLHLYGGDMRTEYATASAGDKTVVVVEFLYGHF
ncbi:MAG: phosphoribosyltransferase [Thermoanaerobaculia bacterium]